MPTILLVDDDQRLIGMIAQVLSNAGYTVQMASNGREALEFLRTHSVDLVLTDLVMPEKEGMETIIELRRTFPDLKIIAMSGWAHGMLGNFLDIASKIGAHRTLAKPFSAQELMKAVRSELGES